MNASIKNGLKKLAAVPVIGVPILLSYRTLVVGRYFTSPFRHVTRWLFASREITNFTYDLTEQNKNYLAAFVSEIIGRPFLEVREYVRELENDTWLIEHVKKKTAESKLRHLADREVWFCKRLGWYAFVRAAKPATIVETGVDKGLGSCVIARALMRNKQEGFPGYYYGTDINPEAGYLFSDELTQYGKILYGDSLESLRKFSEKIDLFINDSDHSASYERAEYEEILSKLSPKALILGDNAHITSELFEFSRQRGRKFLFFQERPAKHWYPGAGIGVSF